MLQSDGEPVSQPKTAALKTDKKTLDWINKEAVDALLHLQMLDRENRPSVTITIRKRATTSRW
jgi:hypothetical protein